MLHQSKKVFFAICAAATLALASTATCRADLADVAGVYHCEGSNADGSHYTGKVKITSEGGAYRVHWWIAGQEYSGIGVVQGNVLAVAFYGATRGVIAYSIETGTLVGKWTALNTGGTILKETLTR